MLCHKRLSSKPGSSAPKRVRLIVMNPPRSSKSLSGVARLHSRPNTLNYKKDGSWQPISSDEMLARSVRLPLGLYSLGVRKGDRVALLI